MPAPTCVARREPPGELAVARLRPWLVCRPVTGPRCLIIGAGFGGLGAARALRQQGIDDITILERADAVGGVWRDNTYPGAACDVPSPLYSWSWSLNPTWTHRYSGQAEILGYLERAAGDAGLLDLVRTGQEVAAATYDEATATWRVATTDGTAVRRRPGHLGGRPALRPGGARPAGPRLLRRAGVPLGSVAPRRPARRHPGRGDRHRRERDPVRAGDRRPGRRR